MRSIFATSLAALVVLLTLSSISRAQAVAGRDKSSSSDDKDSSIDVSGNIGFSNLSGGETTDGKKHIAFGFAGAYNFTDILSSLGFEYSYQMLGSETQSGVTASEHIQSYGPVLRGFLLKSGRVIPYLLVAAGGLSDKATASAGGITASASRNGYYIGFGGGTSIYAGSSWGIRPEVRYERQHFNSTTVDGSYSAASGQNYILGTISVFYQFGGKK